METTSPRNSQLKLIEADERWGGHNSCPGVFLSNLNAYAERLVQTIKESCLERMMLFGESAVRKATAEFMAHYHRQRNHQGLDNALICPEPEHGGGEGEVHRRERLGGLLNYHYRTAA